VSEPTPGPGADLKAAREGLQVSIREVADALNLPARVIEALETDDYDRLPPTVFTRGYLRSYARLLELPSDELLARYPEVTEEVEIASDTRTGTHAAVSGSRKLLLPVSIGVIAILAVVVWLFSRNGGPPTETQQPSEQSAPTSVAPEPAQPESRSLTDREETTMPSAEPEPDIGPPPSDVRETEPAMTQPPSAGESTAAYPPSEADTGSESVRPAEPAQGAAQGAAQEAAVPDSAATEVGDTFRERRITEFGDDRVVLHFTEDCWVEVKTLDGASLYSDLNRAGATLELTGRAPFRVLLGYAPGVSLEFNGEPVALARYSRNNVASLVLGQ